MYYVTTRYQPCDTEKCAANATHRVMEVVEGIGSVVQKEVFRGCKKHVMRKHNKLTKGQK